MLPIEIVASSGWQSGGIFANCMNVSIGFLGKRIFQSWCQSVVVIVKGYSTLFMYIQEIEHDQHVDNSYRSLLFEWLNSGFVEVMVS